MSKKQVINEILDLYDKVEKYRENSKCKSEECCVDSRSTPEYELNKLAKQKLFASVFRYWDIPSVEVKEDDGQYNYLTFDQWVKTFKRSHFDYDSESKKIFEQMPLNNILDYFRDTLSAKYTELVNAKKMEYVRNAKEYKE